MIYFCVIGIERLIAFFQAVGGAGRYGGKKHTSSDAIRQKRAVPQQR